jgi:hypothetical protein
MPLSGNPPAKKGFWVGAVSDGKPGIWDGQIPSPENYKMVLVDCHREAGIVVGLNVAGRSAIVLCSLCAAPVVNLEITGRAAIFQGTDRIGERKN